MNSTNGTHMEEFCDFCKGLGEYKQACGSCEGFGFNLKTVNERVAVPKGVYDGVLLRLAGKGNWTPRGQQGDLIVKVKIRAHPFFKRTDSDIHAIKGWAQIFTFT